MILKHILYSVYFLTVMSMILSCKTTSNINQVADRSITEVLKGLDKHTVSYRSMYAKARVKFNGQESRIGGKMNIVSKKDSLIWMNFKKISIEGARILMTPDSISILYRLDDLYEHRSTQEYLDSYDIQLTFYDLQEALVGNIPRPKKEEIVAFHKTSMYQLDFRRQNSHYQYFINENLTINKMVITDSDQRRVIIQFDDYDDHMFAKRKNIEVMTSEDEPIKISIKFTSVTFDVPKKIKFDIPNHYRRLL